ncbi:DUF998 domain-containing protein [Marilutibacter chinensis]|uniref:DUF998 domain-containing protein n=1 Tax=Marilutibacter chinensis TaxID=2912247 RepID=A0ABS9HWF4_9GAMM|nr:DUF998 domain-containing protein [Lysobacter chinensis]MCF7222702.1 DUF998 domain-containing protein [Lysobacter chinensis]
MGTRLAYWLSWAPVAAAAAFVLTALAGGLAVDGYSHARHPLALLGARGVPGSDTFNLLGWGVPGLLLAMQAVMLRECLPGKGNFVARLGAWSLALSALAFAAQGLWPLDAADLEGVGSRRHALAWMLWWVAYPAAAALLAPALLRQAGQRRAGAWLLLSALAVLACVLSARAGWWPAPGGRLAIAAWFAGHLACGALMRRSPEIAPAQAFWEPPPR